MRLIAYLKQRWTDYQREQRIEHLARSCVDARRPRFALDAWNAMKAEIAQRSPAQVARMERRMGMRARG